MSTGTPAAPAPTSLRGANISPDIRALTKGRLGGNRTLISFAIGFAVVIGIGVAIVALVAPSTKPLCQPFKPCGPPKLPQPLVNQTLWRSTQFGFTLEYPADRLQVAQTDGSRLTLVQTLKDGTTAAIIIRGMPGSISPSQAVTKELGNLNGISQVATDTSAADQILAPGIGHRQGAGGVYVASLAGPQGVSQDVGIGAEAATVGNVTVIALVMSAINNGSTPDAGPQSQPWFRADAIVNSVRWGT